jgi:hypothetical protein
VESETLVDFIQSEIASLEKAMFSLSEQDGTGPRLFSEAGRRLREKDGTDEDGVEVVEAVELVTKKPVIVVEEEIVVEDI